MKKLFFALAATTFISCTRELEDRLPGDWSIAYTENTEVVYNGASSSESNSDAGTAGFNDDGTVIMVLSTSTDTLEWTSTSDSITIGTGNELTSYAIVENTRSRQEYQSEVTESGNNYTFTTTKTIVLTK